METNDSLRADLGSSEKEYIPLLFKKYPKGKLTPLIREG
jgi:hypothetical protein